MINKTIEYNDLFNVRIKEDADLSGETDIIVRSLRQPICSGVKIDKDIINFDIEKELGVEIVGETKMKIAIEDDEEPWDEVIDEMDYETEKEIIETIDENYMEELK